MSDNHLEGPPESVQEGIDSGLSSQLKPERRPSMKLYGGIDLHSNNSYIVLIDGGGTVIERSRVANELGLVLQPWGRIGSRSTVWRWSRPTTGTGW